MIRRMVLGLYRALRRVLLPRLSGDDRAEMDELIGGRLQAARGRAGGVVLVWVREFLDLFAASFSGNRGGLSDRLPGGGGMGRMARVEETGGRGRMGRLRGTEGVAGTIEGWTKDLVQAARALRRTPGFTLVAVVTLGLAIGVNTGVFSVVDAVLLNPLPFPDADRLVRIRASAPGSDRPREFDPSPEFFLQYRDQADLLEDVGTYIRFTSTLRAVDRVERVAMGAVTSTFFSTLDVAPILGRVPGPEDESDVAVISHALWVTWFGSDPGVIGQSFEARNLMRTVIGVMGPEFRFPDERVVLWYPLPILEADIVPGQGGREFVGRMAPGVEHDDLAIQLQAVARRLPERFGGSPEYARFIEQHRPVVRSLKEELVGSVSQTLWVLLGSVGMVLLVACANVANLFLVRGESRQRDLVVRRAIGAARGHLVRSQMAEAILVAGLGGALAVLLAWQTVPLLLQAAPEQIPRLGDVGLHGSTLLFAAGASLFAALACGLVPALRSSAPSLTRLREGGRGSTRRRSWGRDGLVVAQTAMALVLLVGSGLLVRSYRALRNVDPGYELEDIFTFMMAPAGDDLVDARSYAQFHMAFMDRVAAMPSVESVGIVENLPLVEQGSQLRFLTEDMPDAANGGTLLRVTFTGGPYFETMGIELLRGRTFTDADHVSDLGNAIISQSTADLLWPGEDPIGRRLRTTQASEFWEATVGVPTVVGVVEDVKQLSFRAEPDPLVYLSLVGQAPASFPISSPAYAVKTTRADQIAPEIRALVREMAPNTPVYQESTMEDLAAGTMVQLAFTMLTLGIASTLTLVLGALGLYGVLSYVVEHRTQEIGVRMALGARASQVQRMVVAQGARVVIAGVAIGVVVAGGATRALGGLLFGVEAVDAVTFLGVSATMLVVGLLASYLPARRASTVDPIESLRNG